MLQFGGATSGRYIKRLLPTMRCETALREKWIFQEFELHSTSLARVEEIL